MHRFSDLDTGCQTNNRLRTAERKKKTFLKNLLGGPPPHKHLSVTRIVKSHNLTSANFTWWSEARQ